MSSQPSTGDKQRFRCRMQEIKLEPDKSASDITIELQVDGTRVHKLPPIKKGQPLHWTSLCLPCDVSKNSTITLQVTEVHTFQDRVDRAEYQVSQLAGQNIVSTKCNRGVFVAHLELLSEEAAKQAYSEAFVKAQQMEKQPGVLERAGRVGDAFKVLLALGSTMAELDPTGGAKVAFSLCTKAWEFLETQEKQDADLNELVEDIAARPLGSGSYDGTIRIWDAETGAQTLPPLTRHSYAVHSVAFSPNSHRLASASDDHTICIWDIETGQLVLGPLTGHSDRVRSVAFSAHGHRIVSGSLDKTIRIWDAETGGAVLDPLSGHTDWVQSVAFSSDGRWIASGSDDRTVRIWDAKTGEAVLEPIRGHSHYVVSVAFSLDGRRLVSGSLDSTVRIWDAESRTASINQTPTFLPGTQVRVLPPRVTDGKVIVQSAELTRHMRSDLAGWVTSTEGKLLVWLPPDLRGVGESLVCISPGSCICARKRVDLSH